MKLQKMRTLCMKHMKNQDPHFLAEVFQKYARENLYFSDESAKTYASQMMQPRKKCHMDYWKYRTAYANMKFYYWYDKHYMTHPFPNGFESWHKSHYHIAEFIIYEEFLANDGLVKRIRETEGTTGLMRLAKEWTDEFENHYNDTGWEDKDAYQNINKFCEQKKK